MKTRTRRPVQTEEDLSLFEYEEEDEMLDLEHLSEEELEAMLFEPESPPSKGMFNLPTIAGLSIILVGVAYMFQQLGLWSGVDLTALASMLPIIAGILIILLGFGVLSWSPTKKKKKKLRKEVEVSARKKREKVKVELELDTPTTARTRSSTKDRGRRKLIKAGPADKKLAGVAGGIAEYFNLDPTLVRIAFVVGTIASGGPFLFAYLLLAFIMPTPEKAARAAAPISSTSSASSASSTSSSSSSEKRIRIRPD